MSRQDAKHAKKLLGEPPPEADAIARRVIGAAIEVHRHLGPAPARLGARLISRVGLFEEGERCDRSRRGVRPSQHSPRAATARRD